ncbi:hypothetical protein QYE76_039364 [Lolium multiflorum]|uniref:Uncharacterized protein n=1 Tax=Lolium multiflorum TaxID=4521 RepID=A0AAD8T9R6_LOLMU|nr:hypothetical protein QYE76_039364 [Lolium multiflorum]
MGLLDGSDKAPAKHLEVEDSENVKKSVSNPAYEVWLARDQTVLGYLVKGMSPDLLAQVVGLEHTSEVWATVEDIFSSQSRAKVNMLRGALSNTKKLDHTATQYIAKMKGFVSELAAAGKHVDDDELKGYILNGLDGDYNPLVASINAVPSTTLNDLCAQLLPIMPHVAPTTLVVRPPLHVVAMVAKVVAMGAKIKSVVMVVTIDAAMMVTIGVATMVTIGAVMMLVTGARSAVMMMAIGAKSGMMVITVAGLTVAMMAKAKVVVLHKEVVVVAVLPPPIKMWNARFARSTVTLPMNVGGVMLTKMIIILALRRREHMVLTQTGTWTVVLQIISLAN